MSYGFASIDITEPDTATQMDVNFWWPANQYDVALYSHYAYVAVASEISIFDVENPAAIDTVRWISTNAYGITVAGTRAYAAASDGLHILDLTDPEQPVEIGSCTLPSMNRVAVQDTLAVLVGTNGLRIVNITDPTAPVSISTLVLPSPAHDVVLFGHVAYVADDVSGLRVIDISNPTNPVEIGHYNTPGNALAVAARQNIVYVADNTYFGTYECTNVLGFQLTSPNGHEHWQATEPRSITWMSSGINGNVSLFLNSDYPNSPWELIAEDVPNTGTAEWMVSCLVSDACRVKIVSVEDETIFDISDANFSIQRGHIALHPTALDFGDVYPNMTALDTVWIVNSGPDSLLIDSMVCVGSCFGVVPMSAAIPSQDSLLVPVWFVPMGVEGYEGLLTVYSSAGDSTVTLIGNGVTAIGGVNDPFPREFALQSPYPNPFNAATTLRFDVPKTTRVVIQAYDLLGRELATIADNDFAAGCHELLWDCSTCASGVYVIVLSADNLHFTQKAVVVK